jgi:tRNA 2-thiouridine synthesizing protein A
MAEREAIALLDASGLNCPLPILKAKKALGGLGRGAVLEVLATDPGSAADFEVFCRIMGHELVATSLEEGGVLRFLIRKVG